MPMGVFYGDTRHRSWWKTTSFQVTMKINFSPQCQKRVSSHGTPPKISPPFAAGPLLAHFCELCSRIRPAIGRSEELGTIPEA